MREELLNTTGFLHHAEARAKVVSAKRGRALAAAAAAPGAAAAPIVFNLSTAENVLLYDQLRPRLIDFSGLTLEDTQYAFYGDTHNRTGALDTLAAQFLSKAWGLSEPLQKNNVLPMAGTCAALESLGFALCHPGDVVIGPAPCWQGFGYFFNFRPGATYVPFSVSSTSTNPFNLTLDDVKNAYANSIIPPKVLVLTNPHNPLGINYPASLLEAIYDWVMSETKMHIVSDEIYFNSQTDPNAKYTPAFSVKGYDPQRVHVVWGLSKDFGLAGYRSSFIVTRNADLINTLVNKWMYFLSPTSTLPTFTIVTQLFAGTGQFALDLMNDYRKKLTAQRAAVKAALDNADIPYYKDDGAAQFFWLDLRKYLPNVTPAPPIPSVPYDRYTRERGLYNLLSKNNVELEPGHTMAAPEEGWFRLCYSCLPLDGPAGMLAAVQQLVNVLDPLS